MAGKTLKVEIYRWNRPRLRGVSHGPITAMTNMGSGGTRIYGPEMLPGDAKLVATLHLDRSSIQAMLDDYDAQAADPESGH